MPRTIRFHPTLGRSKFESGRTDPFTSIGWCVSCVKYAASAGTLTIS